MYTSTYIYIYIQTDIYIYIYMHIHVNVYIYILYVYISTSLSLSLSLSLHRHLMHIDITYAFSFLSYVQYIYVNSNWDLATCSLCDLTHSAETATLRPHRVTPAARHHQQPCSKGPRWSDRYMAACHSMSIVADSYLHKWLPTYTLD